MEVTSRLPLSEVSEKCTGAGAVIVRFFNCVVCPIEVNATLPDETAAKPQPI